ncbi:MAG: ATP-binding protein, partial [Pseudomonadota bacterium]|nr:ATP-binding protein [Pseudomonadota bacterium]
NAGSAGDASAAARAERRGRDRRSGDRRDAGPPDNRRREGGGDSESDAGNRNRRRDDSLFGAFGATGDDGDPVRDPGTFFDAGWLAAGEMPSDSRFALRHARRFVQAQESALARIYRTYGASRAAIGVGLVFAQALGNLLGGRLSEWTTIVSLLYAVQAITLWLLPRFGSLAQVQSQAAQRRRQWLATIGVDLLTFSVLYVLEAGSPFNYAALLVLPVLMSGVLTSRLMALGTAAAVALLFLVAASRAALGGADVPALMLQSGLAGIGMFAVVLLAAELAGRMVREEVAARGSFELARQQAQLNRLVIEEMVDGVLVVDRRLRVRAANPAARALLVTQGLSPPAPFTIADRSDWRALTAAVEQALQDGEWPEAGRDVTLAFDDGHRRTLRMRVRFMRASGLVAAAGTEPGGKPTVEPGAEPFAVLLLEDVRTLQARIRQEKLAAMGRVSAGIAHEIRNPLAAITQANALLLEDLRDAAQLQLSKIVADNAERLKRLVDDVMELSSSSPQAQRCIDGTAAVAADVADWARTAGIALQGPTASRLRIELPDRALGVSFDPEHLRRVLVNLLDNAHRHAPDGAGSIFLRLAVRDEHWVSLAVLSEGEIIGPETERLLFEPFFSTRSRGSGLGLYICRELCERHGASIDYRPRPSAERLRNEFIVSLRRLPWPDAPPRQLLQTLPALVPKALTSPPLDR